MPRDQDQRPCSQPGCHGAMTYHATGKPASFRGDGLVTYAPGSDPGWLCDKDFRHWQPEGRAPNLKPAG